jgi:hypothetical protein
MNLGHCEEGRFVHGRRRVARSEFEEWLCAGGCRFVQILAGPETDFIQLCV